jgi:arabinofuranan 3-O-arabinosyltransferase
VKRRPASGAAIALAGGVNAVAAGTVLPLPAWWLITRRGGPLRRSLLRWWLLAVVFAITWWLAPLIILGRYSPPFLDWIESAVATTSHASLPSAWRGTTQWVAGSAPGPDLASGLGGDLLTGDRRPDLDPDRDRRRGPAAP